MLCNVQSLIASGFIAGRAFATRSSTRVHSAITQRPEGRTRDRFDRGFSTAKGHIGKHRRAVGRPVALAYEELLRLSGHFQCSRIDPLLSAVDNAPTVIDRPRTSE